MTVFCSETNYVVADNSLNRLQELFRPALEANQMEFHGRTGLVKGFGAGSSYPQFWLRDSATIIHVSRFYYPLVYLTSWLEEHLSHQKEDGQLYDWIAPPRASDFTSVAPNVEEVYRSKGKIAGKLVSICADKNTTEADQESSAVDAAWQVFSITRDQECLRRKIRGMTLLERLDSCLEYLLKCRFNAQYGLLCNAFTADWGDVSPVYADQRCIYLDENTPLVVGLYTNSLFYRAARQLADLHRAVADDERAHYWNHTAAMIQDNITKHLWQEDRGFYRVHLVLTPELTRGWKDDSDIFAMGGNALTALYGIADDGQALQIFDVAQERQVRFGVSTIASVLLPPYPEGFFELPVMREEYSYQNGGQWDWFAGRFLLAEFERGYSRRAYRQLVEIAKKEVGTNALYEWDTREGEGRGSPNLAASAGALAGAVFQGLFGIYLSGDALSVRIRLGVLPGKIHLYEPATDSYVAYEYRYDDTVERIGVDYESNIPGAGNMCICLPMNRVADELLLDGQRVNFETESIGEDRYVTFSTDWRPHRLEVRLKA